MDRYKYKTYKDERDCHTKKVMTKAMYILINIHKKPFVHTDGHLMIFYRFKDAAKYIIQHKKEEIWKVKKVKLDITTL